MSLATVRTGGGTTIRTALAAGLRKELKSRWNVFPATSPINSVTKPTITMIRQQLTKSPTAPNEMFRSTYKLMIISDQKIAETKEDYLDGLVDDVLEALEVLGFLWSTAERETFNDTNPAYIVTLTADNTRQRSTNS